MAEIIDMRTRQLVTETPAGTPSAPPISFAYELDGEWWLIETTETDLVAARRRCDAIRATLQPVVGFTPDVTG